MLKYLYLFILLLCSGMAVQAQPVNKIQNEEPEAIQSEPEEVVSALILLFNDGRLEDSAAYVQGADTNSPFLAELKKLLARQTSDVRVKVADFYVTKKGDVAEVTFQSALQDSLSRAATQKEALQLQRQVENLKFEELVTFVDWKVIPDPLMNESDLQQAGPVRTMVAYLAHPQHMLDLSLLKMARFNMERIAKAMTSFLADWEDEFVKEYEEESLVSTQEGWRRAMGMYIEDLALRIPRSMKGEIYQFNTHLAGKKVGDVKQPSKTIMVYDGQDGRLNFRHDGSAIVLFVDGKIETVNPQQAKNLIWNP